jgi:hypothetical protein
VRFTPVEQEIVVRAIDDAERAEAERMAGAGAGQPGQGERRESATDVRLDGDEMPADADDGDAVAAGGVGLPRRVRPSANVTMTSAPPTVPGIPSANSRPP